MPYPALSFTPEQIQMRDSLHALLSDTLPPEKLQELDETYGDPHEAYGALAQAGWLGLMFAEDYGGYGGSYRDMAVLIETLGFHSLSIATAYQCSTVFAGSYIQSFGSDAMKRRFIPEIIAGDTRLAIAYTEPQAGSDVAAIRTRAKRDGDDYVINGQKCYISCAHVADYIAVAVKTDPDAGRKGISMVLVDTKLPGVDIRPMKSLGRHASRINEIFLDDVRVPAAMLIGEENSAWKMMMKGLNFERLILSAGSAGVCMKAIRVAKDFTENRDAFGNNIMEYQGVSHKLAEMQILAHTSRLHTYHVAELMDAGENPIMETSVAKTYATEAMATCTDLGLQVMGGQGYVAGEMERMFRDARLGPIGGGTSEVMRNVIAAQMMDLYP